MKVVGLWDQMLDVNSLRRSLGQASRELLARGRARLLTLFPCPATGVLGLFGVTLCPSYLSTWIRTPWEAPTLLVSYHIRAFPPRGGASTVSSLLSPAGGLPSLARGLVVLCPPVNRGGDAGAGAWLA